jgi:tetratricopeptide (TPR) repeat protein
VRKNIYIFLVRFLVINFLIITSSFAWAKGNQIQIESIRKDTTLRILFSGENNDFTFNQAENIVSMRFDVDITFGDTSSISQFKNYIKSVDIQKSRLTLTLVADTFKVHKFKIVDKTGIEISFPEFTRQIPNKENKIPEDENNKADNNVDGLEINLDEEIDKSILTFKWSQDVAASAFLRDKRLWVVFDKSSDAKFPNNKTRWFKDFKQELKNDNSQVFSMLLHEVEGKTPSAIMYRTGYEWNVEISNKTIKAKDIRVVSRPLAAPHPRVDIELDEAAREPIRFKDNYVGDELIALPMVDSAIAINDKFTFVDFKILKSLQGGVVKPVSDIIKVKTSGKNYQLFGAAGLNIAPRVYKKHEAKFEDKQMGFKMDDFVEDFQSILSLKSYKIEEGEFLNKVRSLRKTLMESKSREQRARVYANWALFYLANGFYTEGLTIIKLIKKEDPDFGNSYNVKVIEAAMNYMDYEFLPAYNVARSISILEVPLTLRKEVRFWQSITGYMVSGTEDYLNKMDPMTMYTERDGTFLSEYTEPFMMEVGISIVAHKIADKQFNEAQIVIKDLLKMELPPHEKNRVNALAASLYAGMDQPEAALKYWDECISDLDDTLHRSNCRFEKAKFMNQTQRMTLVEYTEELEKLALVWRGDELEIDVLTHLGDAYLQMKEYASALRSWDTIVKYYAFSPESLKLGRKMGDTFTKFFLEGKDEQVPHIKALALFYEFEHLVPIGEMGDEVVLRFVDHLLALDLLNRASAILQHQVSNRLKGTKKEIGINKLAKIYMNNRDPIKALQAINSGDDYTELPNEIADERKYLHAKALHMNRQNDEALKLLKGDLTPEADDIKSDIYWSMKKWREFNDYVEPRIYSIREDDKPVVDKDSDKVLKLAISYLITGEFNLLDDLIKDFGKRMPEGERNSKILDTISKSWTIIKMKKLETQQTIDLITQTVNQIIDVINSAEKEAKK